MTEGEAVEEPGMEKFATQPVPGVPYVASSVTFAEEPDREKLQFMPVASSNISGCFPSLQAHLKLQKLSYRIVRTSSRITVHGKQRNRCWRRTNQQIGF